MGSARLITVALSLLLATGIGAAERNPLFRDHTVLKAVLTAPISQTGARYEEGPTGPDEACVPILEGFARERLAADPELQLVIFGHSHYPQLIEVDDDRHYLNTGDWMRELTWGEVTPDGVTLNRWNPR